MSNAKRVVVTGKGLGSVQAVLEAQAALNSAAQVKLATNKRPTLGASALSAVKEDSEGATWAAEQDGGLKALAENIAKAVLALQSMERDSTNAAQLREAMEKDQAMVHSFITSVAETRLRLHYCDTYLTALIQHLPKDKLGKNVLGNEGVSLGFLRVGTEKNGVVLPISREDGKWDWSNFWTVPHGHERLREALRRWCNAIDKEEETAEKAAIDRLKQDTVSLLEAVQNGVADGAKIYLFAPNYKDSRGEKFYAGGHIQALVKDENISPVAAFGKCEKQISRMIEAGVMVPLKEVNNETFRAQGQNFAWHRTLLRALVWEVEGMKRRDARKQEQDGLAAKYSIPPADWFIRGVVGGTYTYFSKTWTIRDGSETKEFWQPGVALERNEKGEVRLAETLKRTMGMFPEECFKFASPGEKFENLAEPLRSFLRVMYSVWSNIERRKEEKSGEGTGKSNPPTEPKPEPTPEELKAQADERQAEAASEIEAARAKVAQLEAERVAAQETETEELVDLGDVTSTEIEAAVESALPTE